MRTRYKVISVVVTFGTFYFALIPAHHWCLDSGADCVVWKELINATRLVIHTSHVLWDSSGGIKEWSGTPHENGDAPLIEILLFWNWSFLLSMVVLPGAIIAGIVVWDKKR